MTVITIPGAKDFERTRPWDEPEYIRLGRFRLAYSLRRGADVGDAVVHFPGGHSAAWGALCGHPEIQPPKAWRRR